MKDPMCVVGNLSIHTFTVQESQLYEFIVVLCSNILPVLIERKFIYLYCIIWYTWPQI